MQITRRTLSAQHPLSEHYLPIVDRVLRNRGITCVDQLSVQAKHLQHYKALWDIDNAAIILADAIQAQLKICIVGDFDADGATSTALCILALRKMGAEHIDYIVPNRFDYGYGLTTPVVDLAAKAGAQLIVTVDNGISSIDGVAHAKSLGMQVIVTDHHLPGDSLPVADAIVNPNHPKCHFASKNLAGVGVAFYVMSATKNELEKRDHFASQQLKNPNMAEFLDIVAVGTVADVVVLDKNNRILVHQGIQRIRSGKTRPGILALLNLTNRNHKRCTTTDIGFVIGPRLNAAGRLQDMSHGIECLLCESPQQAAQYAAELDGLNQSRREIEQSMREDAEHALVSINLECDILPASIVLYQEDFHQGVVGIVAGRIKEKYYRPTIVFANESDTVIKGSARSIEGVHIRDALARIQSIDPTIMHKFGGHAMAAGLSLNKADLPDFIRLLNSVVSEMTKGNAGQATIYSDGELAETDITLENASALKFAFPWGQGFEEPIFDGIFDVINQRLVGQHHLKMTLAKNGVYFDAIAFSVDTQEWPNLEVRQVHIAYKLDINEYRGQTNIQLLVSGISVHDSDSQIVLNSSVHSPAIADAK